jgi:hypothetical protein
MLAAADHERDLEAVGHLDELLCELVDDMRVQPVRLGAHQRLAESFSRTRRMGLRKPSTRRSR